MNKIKEKESLRHNINCDKFELQTLLCENIRFEVLNLLKDYFVINEADLKLNLLIDKINGSVLTIQVRINDF